MLSDRCLMGNKMGRDLIWIEDSHLYKMAVIATCLREAPMLDVHFVPMIALV